MIKRAMFTDAQLKEAGQDFTTVIHKVIAFIEAPAEGLELPLDIQGQGRAFQNRVWQALRDIPEGITASYAELAGCIYWPAAVHAVAPTCAANKLVVEVPCHRLVRKNGQAGGNRWGRECKQALLECKNGRSEDFRARTAMTDSGGSQRMKPDRRWRHTPEQAYREFRTSTSGHTIGFSFGDTVSSRQKSKLQSLSTTKIVVREQGSMGGAKW
jgi:O-6-methylguanine DNA methyltransferase